MEPHRIAHQRGRAAQVQRGIGRTGKADHVLRPQPVQHVAQSADHQLHRTFGQDAAFDDHAETGLGQIAGLRRRFDDGGHPRQQRRRQFFQHPPDREVERVDMHRDTLQRHADMLAQKAAVARKLLDLAIDIDLPVRHLAAALAGHHHHRADTALDIDRPVAPGRPGQRVQRVQLFLALRDVAAQRLDHARAVVKTHRAQGRSTRVARPVQHRLRIRRGATGHRDHRAGHRPVDRPCIVTRGNPSPRRIAFRFQHDESSLLDCAHHDATRGGNQHY